MNGGAFMIPEKEQLDAFLTKLANGEQPDPQPLVSALTPDMLNRMLRIEFDAGRKLGTDEKETEIICRLIASGMPEGEIAVTLCVKADVVCDAAKYKKEKIATYARQLKGRQRRRKQAK